MKLESNIGWTDCTANAVIGCSRISEGCRECYAFRDTPARVLRARGIETWGPKGVRHLVAGFAEKVRRLNKLCVCDRCHETFKAEFIGRVHGEVGPTQICGGGLRPIRCFSDSNSDFLDDRWPVETLWEFLKAIHDAPNVIFQLLTKRPENWRSRLCAAGPYLTNGFPVDWMHEGKAPSNIWLGVSAENQEWWDKRRELILKIPAVQYFFSLEPLLGPINLHLEALGKNAFDVELRGKLWFIVGGESGKNHLPCEVS